MRDLELLQWFAQHVLGEAVGIRGPGFQVRRERSGLKAIFETGTRRDERRQALANEAREEPVLRRKLGFEMMKRPVIRKTRPRKVDEGIGPSDDRVAVLRSIGDIERNPLRCGAA